MSATNASERFVHELCRKSFLSLWSVENPLGPNGKELCDALIVVGDHVLVFSVKNCAITQSGDDELDLARWERRAVGASIKQLSGATCALNRMKNARRRDNPDVVLPLPAPDQRRLHLVAVALGGDDRVAIGSGKHSCGFVHVFDRETAETLLRELDTVSDFVGYLAAKEEFAARGVCLMEGGEKDLLAMFLRERRKFPREPDHLLLTSGLWEQAISDPQFVRRKEADRISHAWDKLIEEFAGHLRGGTLLGVRGDDLLPGVSEPSVEAGLRYMALENRFARRFLGDAFIGFIRTASEGVPGSRTTRAPSGVVYAFVTCPRSASPTTRGAVLGGYCSILREEHPDAKAIVGIITETPDGSRRHTFGLLAIDKPLDDETKAAAAEARRIGILRKVTARHTHLQEYPRDPAA